jgi:hypothetical protein
MAEAVSRRLLTGWVRVGSWTSASEFCDWRSGTYVLTYLLTSWCRVLLEKLTGLQLVKKFPALHGTRRFITALTTVRHPSLSWANPIQSIYPHPTSGKVFVLVLRFSRQ